jgi:hypothetical protein
MSAQAKDELGITVGKWNALVRRARMTDKQKLSALLISSYADPDGTGMGSAETSPDQRSEEVGVDESREAPESGPDQRSSIVGVDNPDQRSNDPRSTLTLDEPPPPLRTSPLKPPSPKTTAADARTDLAVAREKADPKPAEVIELFPGASQEARYRPPLRWTTRAQAEIAEATARRAAARQAHKEAT